MNTKFWGRMALACGLGLAGTANAQTGGYSAAGYAAGSAPPAAYPQPGYPSSGYAPPTAPAGPAGQPNTFQANAVPVHPQLQQPPAAGQWQPNRSATAPFHPQWTQVQPPAVPGPRQAGSTPQPAWMPPAAPPAYAASSSIGLPSGSPGAAGHPPQASPLPPRSLPSVYRSASMQGKANGAGPETTELLPQGRAAPQGYAGPQSPAAADASPSDYAATSPPPPAQGNPPYAAHGHVQPGHHPHAGQAVPGQSIVEQGGACRSCEPSSFASPFQQALKAPWSGLFGQHGGGYGGRHGCGPGPVTMGPVPLKKWFGGGNLLFLTMEQNNNRRLLFDVGDRMPTLLSTDDVDPSGTVGMDVFLGRYIHCGQHALTLNYFRFDPDGEMASAHQPTAGMGALGNPFDYRVPQPGWNNVSYNVGNDADPTNDMTLYEMYDMSVAYRVRRDVSFQGLEANLVSFGLGGARRGAIGPTPGPCKTGCGPRPGCVGSLLPGCGDRLQIQTTHGLRWFQMKDAFQFAASRTDYVHGTTNDDFYYDVDTENNLFGYQFGARLDYALSRKLNVHFGSKFGLYANDAEFRSRIGTTDMPAYVNAAYPQIAGTAVMTEDSDTVLATLGELDLGLGYRFHRCWTVTGGYRLYGITGVATSVGSIADDLGHLPTAGQVRADDSIILHGGYVGLEYNW